MTLDVIREKSKFLLVDDREENLIALELLLGTEDAEIHKARSGTQALELMLDHEFALALIDVQMPEMNGFELAELMRGTERTKLIPIIFVTAGMRSAQNTFKGYESGAVDFLYKPLDPFIVKSKVRVFLDLARQKRLLNTRIQEIQHALETLRKTETELQKAVQIREEFLSIASHELKTPLTPLRLQIQTLIRLAKRDLGQPLETDKVIAIAQKSDAHLRRITALIETLLDVTRLSNGALTLNLERVDLSQLIQEVADQFGEPLKQAGISLTLDLEPGVSLDTDVLRMEQVLGNLIQNAIKYAPRSELSILLKQNAANVHIEVKDTGPGIREEDQKRIFLRFERAIEDQNVSGLGLGLYISKQIIEAQKGRMTLQSHPQRGCSFTIEIPHALALSQARDSQALC